jgi:hypothetical protein
MQSATLAWRCWIGLLGAWALVACGDDAGGASDVADTRASDVSEIAQQDGVGEIDFAEPDASELDAPPPETDEPETHGDDVIADDAAESPADAAHEVWVDGTGQATPAPGFGVISGDCGFVAAALDDAAPSLWRNRIDFGDDPYDDEDSVFLSDGGREILADGNAGGSSLLSEVFAFEMLARCEGAELLKTENEIVYAVAAKITDMIVAIDDRKVGANPTRAVGFPFDAPYSVEQARTVLEKKLGDINSSSAAVADEDRWVKQILTVFAYGEEHAARVEEAWHALEATLRADTIVVVTITDGDDRFIYSNQ